MVYDVFVQEYKILGVLPWTAGLLQPTFIRDLVDQPANSKSAYYSFRFNYKNPLNKNKHIYIYIFTLRL